MRISRASVGLTALAVALAGAGIPALGQQKPESILPPGFDQPSTPAPRPATRPTTAPRPVPSATATSPTAGTPGPASTPASVTPTPAPVATDPATGLPAATPTPTVGLGLSRYTLPEDSRRSLDMVGIVSSDRMMNPAAFGTADGRYIERLMRLTNAPVASRWVSIALRRLLVQPLSTPAHVNGADFAAERAWLLLRMGEPVVARAIVQSVDPDNYTPKLYQIALQAALATGDVGAMCPLAEGAVKVSPERGWVLARMMCAGLSQVPGQLTPLMNQASRTASGIDLLLAQKIAGQGSNRQDVTIEWNSVSGLDTWRFGLATAAGETIPDELFDGAPLQLRYWQVLSPRLDPIKRAQFAEIAAAQGILSNAALVDLYGQIDAGDDQNTAANAVASDLKNAYTASGRDARLDALRGLWREATGYQAHYGRLVLTAKAATRIPVAGATEGSDDLIASMFSAGMDRSASRWKNSVTRGSLGWALITVGDPDDTTRYSSGDVGAFSGSADQQKMFAAGLAGIGRLDASVAQSYGVDVAGENSWTRKIDRAAAAGRPGEVLLLAAVGMQTPAWRGVSPQALFHIVNALRAVGLGAMARMVAVEAVTRV
ncbi:MAG: hypothetical protein V4459_05770 [Pseudomonadota bacterium]